MLTTHSLSHHALVNTSPIATKRHKRRKTEESRQKKRQKKEDRRKKTEEKKTEEKKTRSKQKPTQERRKRFTRKKQESSYASYGNITQLSHCYTLSKVVPDVYPSATAKKRSTNVFVSYCKPSQHQTYCIIPFYILLRCLYASICLYIYIIFVKVHELIRKSQFFFLKWK